MSIVRHGFESARVLYELAPQHQQLRANSDVLALVLLIGGLFAIWFGFAAIGLGIRFRTSDLIWIAVMAILAFVPYLLSWRAVDAYALIRQLLSLSPVLLAVPALIALLLHRIEQEMARRPACDFAPAGCGFSGDAIDRADRQFAGVAHPSQISAGHRRGAGWTSIWFFTLAAAYRWRLTLSVRE